MSNNVVSKNKLHFVQPMEKDGKPIVHLKSGNFLNVRKKFDKLFIVGLVSRIPPFLFVKDVVQKVWNLKSWFVMKPYGERCFSSEFYSNDDKEVLETGCFHIASQLFVVRLWQLFVEVELEDMKSIPIWVILKKFPMELWDDEGFSIVGCSVGIPLFTDRLTKERKRASYARIYVEIDTRCKYHNSVTVVVDDRKAYSLPIEYNW